MPFVCKKVCGGFGEMAQEKDPAPIYLKIKGLGIHENILKKSEIKVELFGKTRYLYMNERYK